VLSELGSQDAKRKSIALTKESCHERKGMETREIYLMTFGVRAISCSAKRQNDH
jgi:hypothetical protein